MLTIDDLKEIGILSYGHRMDLFVSSLYLLHRRGKLATRLSKCLTSAFKVCIVRIDHWG